MKNFDDYEVIDFVLNDSFVQWASGAANADDGPWSLWHITHPNKTEVFNQARQIVLQLKIKPVRSLTNAEVDQLINEVLEKNQLQATSGLLAKMPARGNNTWLRVAATLFLAAMLISLVYIYRSFKSAQATNTLSASVQSQFIQKSNETSAPIWLRLPDKSSVILKPGSQLRYPRVFAALKREVYLSGEAFFEVTKNPKQPFFVYANEMTTRVLGTSFTVTAFKGDKNFKVVVNTGRVAVFAGKGDQNGEPPVSTSLLVVPNQQATFYRKEVKLVKNNLEKPSMLSKEVSTTLFKFDETPLSKVIEVIREAYGINISYNEKNLANCPLTASLTDQPLYEKLDLICKAVEAHYTVTDGDIYIDGKGCH